MKQSRHDPDNMTAVRNFVSSRTEMFGEKYAPVSRILDGRSAVRASITSPVADSLSFYTVVKAYVIPGWMAKATLALVPYPILSVLLVPPLLVHPAMILLATVP